MQPLPPAILSVLSPFSTLFFRQGTWMKVLLILSGALLCRGGRTVCGILRVLGMKGEQRFEKYHRLLNRDKYSLHKGAKILLGQIIKLFDGPIVIAIDEHIERRSGRKIKSKGCYRDAVKSSKGFLVKCFGLKWITVMVLTKFPWTGRIFALPFLTVLAPSEKANERSGKTHKTTIDWAIQIVMQIRRWLPDQVIIFTGDGGFANISLVWVCLKYKVYLVTRLRSDARLFDFPPERDGPGRPAKKGKKLLTPKEIFKTTDIQWIKTDVQWYGGILKTVEFVTLTCLWHVMGHDPVPIRLVLLRDPDGKYESIPLMSTEVSLTAIEIIEAFVKRWNQEVTHREVREHLGVETQRQWSDLAIMRSTPTLFGLYTITMLIADALHVFNPLKAQETAWYQKRKVTFSDALTAVRKHLLEHRYLNNRGSSKTPDPKEIPPEEGLRSLIDQLAQVA